MDEARVPSEGGRMYASTHRKTVREALDYMWSDPDAHPMMRSAVRLFVWKESPIIAFLETLDVRTLQSSLQATFNGTDVNLVKPADYPVEIEDAYERWRDLVVDSSADPDYVDDTWLQSDYPLAFIELEDQYRNSDGIIQFYSLSGMNVTSLNHFVNMLRPGHFNPSQHDGYAYQYSYYRDLGDTPPDWNAVAIATHPDTGWSRDLQFAFFAELGELKVFPEATTTCQEYAYDSGKPDWNWRIQPVCSDEERDQGVIWNSCDNLARHWAERFLSAVYEDYYQDDPDGYGWFTDNLFSSGFFGRRWVRLGYGFVLHAAIDAITPYHIIPTLGNQYDSHQVYEKFIKEAYELDALPDVAPFDACAWGAFQRRLAANRFRGAGIQVRETIRLAAELAMSAGAREMVDLNEAWQLAEETAAEYRERVERHRGEEGYYPNCPPGLPRGYLSHPHDAKCSRCANNGPDNAHREVCEILWESDFPQSLDPFEPEYHFWGNALHHQTWRRNAHKFLNIGTTAVMAALTQLAWAKFGSETGLGEAEIFYGLTEHSRSSYESPVGLESHHPHRHSEQHELDIEDSPAEFVEALSLLFMSETQLDPRYRFRIQLKVHSRRATYDEDRDWPWDYVDQGTVGWEDAIIEYEDRQVTGVIDMAAFGSGGPGYWENQRFLVSAGPFSAGGGISIPGESGTRYLIVRRIKGLRILVEPKPGAPPSPGPVEYGFGILDMERTMRLDPIYLSKLNQLRERALSSPGELSEASYPDVTASLAAESSYALKLADAALFEMSADAILDVLSPYGIFSKHPHSEAEAVTRDLDVGPFAVLTGVEISFVPKSEIRSDCRMTIALWERRRIADKSSRGWSYRDDVEVRERPAAIRVVGDEESVTYGHLSSKFVAQDTGSRLRLSLSDGEAEIPTTRALNARTREVSEICGIVIGIEPARRSGTSTAEDAWGFALQTLEPITAPDRLFLSSLTAAGGPDAAPYKEVFRAVRDGPRRRPDRPGHKGRRRRSPVAIKILSRRPFVERLDQALVRFQEQERSVIDTEAEIEAAYRTYLPVYIAMVEDEPQGRHGAAGPRPASAVEFLSPELASGPDAYEGPFRDPTRQEVQDPRAFRRYVRSAAAYRLRQDACRLAHALLLLRARRAVHEQNSETEKAERVQEQLDRGSWLQKCLLTYLRGAAVVPGSPEKHPIRTDKPYLFNKRSRETHRTGAPCRWAAYIRPENREYVDVVDADWRYCDYCFPDQPDG
jgi:hypothetical protein